jgi:hypothetical protein
LLTNNRFKSLLLHSPITKVVGEFFCASFSGFTLNSFSGFILNLFQKQFPPYAASYLVSNPFSSRCQELSLVALPPPEKVVFNWHRLFAAVGATGSVTNKSVYGFP